jgi:16S rRNA (cytidine1402-2'-O)-methyltransferase
VVKIHRQIQQQAPFTVSAFLFASTCYALVHMNGTLHVVATPIGNLEDITLRALRVLGESDLVLCEDTRVTKKLLTHYDISTPCMSYHEHSGAAKYEKVLNLLIEGKTLALVSDAGTPTVSDPGARLVDEVRTHLPEVRIDAIPGPSAVAAALSVAGMHGDVFTFVGFPPHKKGRKTFFDTVAACPSMSVLYESPHRIMKALEALRERLSDERTVVVCRELTKMHEEVVRGSATEVTEHFLAHPDTVRGEFVVIVAPSVT